jgi:Flp pilus assembly protein TadG
MGGWIRRSLATLWANSAGGIAVVFAIGAPAFALLVCGSVDLFAVHAARTKMQDAADAAALAVAKQLAISGPDGGVDRARLFVDEVLVAGLPEVEYQVSAEVSTDSPTVTVRIAGWRASFFGNLLPPGGWRMSVQSTASAVASTPLCVLATSEHGKDKIGMDDQSLLTAPSCLVHANGDIDVKKSAWLRAAMVQSSGSAAGRIEQAPQTDAPEIVDPFKNMSLAAESSCAPADITDTELSPGVHCGDVKIKEGVLTLKPGVHYFQKGKLELGKGTGLYGRDVVLIFDKHSDFKIKDDATLDLTGIRSGIYAGFVVITTPANTGTFEISTTSAKQLLGTVYIPAAKLLVSGDKNKVNDAAPWTVIVAKSIEMRGSPHLLIQSNYAASDVPVPAGVGPMQASVRLVPTS